MNKSNYTITVQNEVDGAAYHVLAYLTQRRIKQLKVEMGSLKKSLKEIRALKKSIKTTKWEWNK